MERIRLPVVALLLLACAACTGPAGAADAPFSASSTPTGPSADGELVTSEKTLPTEAADDVADIATTASDVTRAWDRFDLDAAPPVLEQGTALLFRGFGESGSCPTTFHRLEVVGDEVRLAGPRSAPEAGDARGGEPAVRACTADFSPRTLVVAVPVAALPQGAFRFEGHTLSATALVTAPSGPSVVNPWTDQESDLAVTTSPPRVAAGDRVDVQITTGSTPTWHGGWPLLLERWEDQRWLPVGGGRPGASHPATRAARTPMPAGTTSSLAAVDTSGLAPGDYRVFARVGLGGAGGSSGVQGFFTVTD